MGLFSKKQATTFQTNANPFADCDPSTLSKLTVFGYTGKFSNYPIIEVLFNNTKIGEIAQDEMKVFEVPAPGMVLFKFKRKTANVAMPAGDMAVQLDWDRVWGGLIAKKV